MPINFLLFGVGPACEIETMTHNARSWLRLLEDFGLQPFIPSSGQVERDDARLRYVRVQQIIVEHGNSPIEMLVLDLLEQFFMQVLSKFVSDDSFRSKIVDGCKQDSTITATQIKDNVVATDVS